MPGSVAETDASQHPVAWAFDTLRAPPPQGRSAPDITVALLDQGVDIAHPELQHAFSGVHRREAQEESRATAHSPAFTPGATPCWGANFTQSGPPTVDPHPVHTDWHHGTDLARMIVGARHGLARSARVISMVIEPTDISRQTQAIADAVRFAVQMRAHIINASFALPWADDGMIEAFNEADQAGVLTIAPAGNADADLNATPVYPAAFDMKHLIAVGAISPGCPEHLSDHSAFGTKVHLAAPGIGLEWATPCRDRDREPGMTSYATAWVSGAAALTWSRLLATSATGPRTRRDQCHQVRKQLLAHSRRVRPRKASGKYPDRQRIKRWGSQLDNPILDLGWLHHGHSSSMPAAAELFQDAPVKD